MNSKISLYWFGLVISLVLACAIFCPNVFSNGFKGSFYFSLFYFVFLNLEYKLYVLQVFSMCWYISFHFM